MSRQPALVAVAHGTRTPAGPETIETLMALVRRRLPDVLVRTSYVELNEPSFADTIAAQQQPTVVVPLLLSRGYHVKHDLPSMARLSAVPVRVARPLGPHPLLAALMCRRLQAAGARRGDAVVMVAAGSRDQDGSTDALVAGRLLQAHWGSRVEVTMLSGNGSTVQEGVERLQAEGHRRVAAVPYLLAPGAFVRLARLQAGLGGCFTVAGELGPDRVVADLVVRRYQGLAAAPASAERVA